MRRGHWKQPWPVVSVWACIVPHPVSIEWTGSAARVVGEPFHLQLWWRPFQNNDRLELVHASWTDSHACCCDYQAAALVETIEHLDPRELSRMENSIFADYGLETVVITTPNGEYNTVLGMAPGEKRDPDHRFEWSRARFRKWCRGVAGRHGYRLASPVPHPFRTVGRAYAPDGQKMIKSTRSDSPAQTLTGHQTMLNSSRFRSCRLIALFAPHQLLEAPPLEPGRSRASSPLMSLPISRAICPTSR